MNDQGGRAARVGDAYRRWAACYDEQRNPTRDLAAALVARELAVPPGATVVEFGCGTGGITRLLAPHAARVFAMDLSQAMLARAQTRDYACPVEWRVHDVTEPWPVSAPADLVVGTLVLEHLPDLGPVLAHAAAALAPGGRLWLCELHPYRQHQGKQAWFADPKTGARVDVDAWHHDTADYVTAGLAAGLTLERLGEHRDPDAPRAALPRLLTLTFRR